MSSLFSYYQFLISTSKIIQRVRGRILAWELQLHCRAWAMGHVYACSKGIVSSSVKVMLAKIMGNYRERTSVSPLTLWKGSDYWKKTRDGGFFCSRPAAERGGTPGDVGRADRRCAPLRRVLQKGERSVYGLSHREQGPAQMSRRRQSGHPVRNELLQEGEGQLQRGVHELLDVFGLW